MPLPALCHVIDIYGSRIMLAADRLSLPVELGHVRMYIASENDDMGPRET